MTAAEVTAWSTALGLFVVAAIMPSLVLADCLACMVLGLLASA